MKLSILLASAVMAVPAHSHGLQIGLVEPSPSLVGQAVSVFVELSEDAPAEAVAIRVRVGSAECMVTLPERHCFVRPTEIGSNDIHAHLVGPSGNTIEQSDPVSHDVIRKNPVHPLRVSVPDDVVLSRFAIEQPMSVTETAISGDGKTMAYVSHGQVYVTGLETGLVRRVWRSLGTLNEKGGSAEQIALSGDGSLLAFVDITFVWLLNLETEEATLLNGFSESPFGYPWAGGDPSISASGNAVVFQSGVDEFGQPFVGRIYLYNILTHLLEEISVASDGTPANDSSLSPDVSADGKRVVYTSSASNLVADAVSTSANVYLRDRSTGETRLITKGFDGSTSNGDSFHPAISADGEWIAFQSEASNLIPDDADGLSNMFLYELATGDVQRVETGFPGGPGSVPMWPGISADGRFLTHVTLPEGGVVFDRQTQVVSTPFMPTPADPLTIGLNPRFGSIGVSDDGARLSGPAYFTDRPLSSAILYQSFWDSLSVVNRHYVGEQSNGASGLPTLSNAARRIAFVSQSTNLTSSYSGYGWEVFVRDLQMGKTWEPALPMQGGIENVLRISDAPRISSDGDTLVYSSALHSETGESENHRFRIRVVDLETGNTETVPAPEESFSYVHPQVSGEGQRVLYGRGWPNPAGDPVPGFDWVQALYLYDRATDSNLELASDNVFAFGLSENGEFVAFHSRRGDLDSENETLGDALYIYDVANSSLMRIDIPFFEPHNHNGRIFVSNNGELVVYGTRLLHLDEGTYSELPQPREGEQWFRINAMSLSADGRYQVYAAIESGVHLQVFVHDHIRQVSREISVTPDGGFGSGNSYNPAISADGLHIVFESLADDLVAAGDSNAVEDIYLVVNPLEVISVFGFEAK